MASSVGKTAVTVDAPGHGGSTAQTGVYILEDEVHGLSPPSSGGSPVGPPCGWATPWAK
jgi:hypothetical protein